MFQNSEQKRKKETKCLGLRQEVLGVEQTSGSLSL